MTNFWELHPIAFMEEMVYNLLGRLAFMEKFSSWGATILKGN
jgi:hypothetical protein